MRYVIIDNERKQCRAKDPDHCRYHKGITHYKTKDAADKALDMEMNKKSQKRLMKTSDTEHYSPKQSMAARYEDLREVDDSKVGWSEDDATKYDEKTQRQPVGVNVDYTYSNRAFSLDDDGLEDIKDKMVGKRIEDVKENRELRREEGNLACKILMEDKTWYLFSDDEDTYDGFYGISLKSLNNNGEPVTDIIKTKLPVPSDDNFSNDVYDLTVMTKDGPIMEFNVAGYQDVINGPTIFERKSQPYLMVCGQKVTKTVTQAKNYHYSNIINNSDNGCYGQFKRLEKDNPSTAIAAKMRINDCNVDGKKTPVVTEFLIEPKDGDGTPIVKNVETVLPNGERVRNKTITDSVNSIILDKQGLDDSVTNTLYNANKNNENVEIRAIGFYNTKE